MNLGLINSAWQGGGVGTADGIRRTRAIGFDTIDMFADPLETDDTERRLIKETCREVGLPIVSVCCVALGIADFNRSVREFHAGRCEAYLNLVYELEARNLLLVLGEYVWQREVIRPEDQWNWAVEGVRALGGQAAKLGIEIAIELEPFKLSLVNSVASMEKLLDEVDCSAVKANIDVSHLALTHTPAEDIGRLKGRIGHAHFSDCDGQVHGDLPPGRGVVDFPPYLRAIRETGYDGTLSIELEYSPEPERITEWVEEA